jgi:hypothetical protein
MKILVANLSSELDNDELARAVAAVQRQVSEDFAPLWGMDATVRATAAPSDERPNPEINQSDAMLYVAHSEADPNNVQNAVGYHAKNHAGVPYGFMFIDVAARVGEPWSVTLSHEVLEAVADPEVNLLVVAPDPDDPKRAVIRPYEVADPVQGDSYSIDNVAVSDFVTPLYFARLADNVYTQTDYLESGLVRFGVRAGGYYTYIDLATGKEETVFGRMAEERVRIKEKAFARLGIARRVRKHAALGLNYRVERPDR